MLIKQNNQKESCVTVAYPLISDEEYELIRFDQSREQARPMIHFAVWLYLCLLGLDFFTLGLTAQFGIISGFSLLFTGYSWWLLKKLAQFEELKQFERHLWVWLIALLGLQLISNFLMPRNYLGHFYLDIWLCVSIFFIVPLSLKRIWPLLFGFVLGELALIFTKNTLTTSHLLFLISMFIISGITGHHFASRLHFYRLRLFSAEKEMVHRANTDPLTGIANRREFLRVSEVELQRHVRLGKPLSIILLDLDYFKQLSLNFGPQVGDIVLIEVSNRVKRATRNYDCVGRYSTEEFCVLLPEASEEVAIRVAERARSCIVSIPVTASGREVKVSACVGVASLQSGDNLNSLLQRADDALKNAKHKTQELSTSLFQPFA
jgi:diguanylate cyclase (GGDEF)-like protein